jgi:long-chain acyl-CoA synthetase
MGASSSVPFDYESQLVNDRSRWYSNEVDEKGVLVAPPEADAKTCIRDGKNPRRRIGITDLISVPHPDENDGNGWRTVWELFQRGVQKFGSSPAFGTRIFELDEQKKVKLGSDKTAVRGKYVWQSYSEAQSEILSIASGIVKLGYKAGEVAGIFAPNRVEWVHSQLAAFSQSMRVVALYPSLGTDAVAYIAEHAEISLIFSAKENVDGLLKVAAKGGMKIKHIIQFDVNEVWNNINDTVEEDQKKKASELGVELIGLSELKKLSTDDVFPNPPKPDDIAFIMYTSGTTGNPKGALLSHRNIVATISSVPLFCPLSPADRHLSYLPLAHIFETLVQGSFWLSGGSIGFFQNNIKKLTDDLCALRPTFLPGVPRVFSRIYQTVFNSVAQKSCIARYFFSKFYNTQCHNIRNGLPRDATADKKVFIPLREKVGLDQCRVILTGAAPCPPYLLEFLKVAIGSDVLQGYGMTENSAGATVCDPKDRTVGHTGGPNTCCEVKLVDIDDMNYKTTDKPHPRGEVWVRGDNVFMGYYKDEKATSETLFGRWVASGDVGRWNPNGTLSIIDRKKNLFKLSQGEYVAAEAVEQEYGQCGLVAQIWVYGNSFKSTLIGVVVPNGDILASHCRSQGWWIGSAESKVGTDEFSEEFKKTIEGPTAANIKKFIREQLKQHEKVLKGYEKLAEIVVVSEIDRLGMGFSEVNQCLTPTFKLRRPQLLQKFIKQLKAAYTAIGEAPAPDEKWPGEQ